MSKTCAPRAAAAAAAAGRRRPPMWKLAVSSCSCVFHGTSARMWTAESPPRSCRADSWAAWRSSRALTRVRPAPLSQQAVEDEQLPEDAQACWCAHPPRTGPTATVTPACDPLASAVSRAPLFLNTQPLPLPPSQARTSARRKRAPRRRSPLTCSSPWRCVLPRSSRRRLTAKRAAPSLPPSRMRAVWICSPWARVLTAITVERAQVRRDYQTLGGEMEIGRRCDEGGAPLRPSAVRPPTSREPAAWSLTALTARAQKFEKAALADKERYKTECAAVRFGALCLPC